MKGNCFSAFTFAVVASSTALGVALPGGRAPAPVSVASPVDPVGIPALAASPLVAPALAGGYGHLPLSFEPNVGQVAKNVKYLSRGPGYTLGLTDRGAVMMLRKPVAKTRRGPDTDPKELAVKTDSSAPPAVIRIGLAGMRTQPSMTAEHRQEGVSHYMIGNDPSKYHSNVANYGAVRYSQVYPGIDWLVYGNPQQLEYDLIVAPHADPKPIKLTIEGAERLSVDASGDLLMQVQGQMLKQQKPVIYQTTATGEKQAIEGHYRLDAKHHQVQIALGDYDRSRPLVIDPSFYYSTYLGGGYYDAATAIAVDSSGNAYVAGYTSSINFPTANPLQASNAGSYDAFVTKLNASGSARLYSTYLGGGDDDYAAAIAVDSSGNAIVAGNTYSTNFPTTNPIQASFAGAQDVFVTKLNATGSARLYSTYLGGSGADEATAIAVDSSGNATVAGDTSSTNFPTTNPIQASNAGGYDAFVTRLNASGSARVYSTYLGGSSTDEVTAIAVDSSGNATVAGYTYSTNFPTTNPRQASNAGGFDAFVTKLNAAGSARLYSSYLGGSSNDFAQAIAVDSSGNAYVAGRTSSTNFPTTNPLQASNAGGDDAFVVKLYAEDTGSLLLYSTYLGGSSTDEATAIAVDSSGNATVAGDTSSTNFPTTNPLQAGNAGGTDAFVTRLNASGSVRLYSTYLGGSGADEATAIAVDSSGNAYVVGVTSSTNFLTANPLQASNAGNDDAFVSKIGEPSAVQFDSAHYSVDESGGTATVTVERVAPFDGAATVQYATSNGSAVAGSDYTAASGTLKWASGETVKSFTVPILDNGTPQPDRTINLTLSKPGLSGVLGSPDMAVLVINDDDAPNAGVAFGASSYSVSEAGGTATITVVRTGNTSGTANVSYATSNSSAIAGTDYTAKSGTLSWAAGETAAKSIAIPIIDNFTENGDKTVNLSLSAPSGAVLSSPSTAVLTIVDDEAGKPGNLALSAGQYNVLENAGTVTISVVRVSGLSGPVCAQASTSNGSAIAGTDYTATFTSVCFADNETGPKSFTIPIISNTVVDGTRSFVVNLSNPTGGGLGVPGAAAVSIADDDTSNPGTLQFTATTYTVTEGQVGRVYVSRIGGSSGAVSVQCVTQDGTAVQPGDYTKKSATLSWADGDSASKSIPITTIDDTGPESNETFNVIFDQPPTGGATVGTPSTATLTIIDNDGPAVAATPQVAFGAANYSAVQGQPTASVTINRSGSPSGAVSVQLVRPADPLSADQSPVVQTISFADGDASTQSIDIPLAGYNVKVGTQQLMLMLQNPSHAQIGNGPALATLTVQDGRAPAAIGGGGSGSGGAFGLASLLPLMGLVAVRRKRRNGQPQTMKRAA